jgi:phosphopantetheinyl transferase
MPVFFQHQESNTPLILWEALEDESFFREALPSTVLDSMPTHAEKRKQYLSGRFLLQQLDPHFPYEQLRVATGGRPYLADSSAHFSISHAGTYIAAILDPSNKVGVDVEQITERAHRVRRKFLAPVEEEVLKSFLFSPNEEDVSHAYTLAWSVKETAFKALHQSGVDFIRDLPIEQMDAVAGGWLIKIGGKGMGMKVAARIIDALCVSWTVMGR